MGGNPVLDLTLRVGPDPKGATWPWGGPDPKSENQSWGRDPTLMVRLKPAGGTRLWGWYLTLRVGPDPEGGTQPWGWDLIQPTQVWVGDPEGDKHDTFYNV